MDIIERIEEKENQFDRVQEALYRLEQAIADFYAIQDLVTDLSHYYDRDWRTDFEADERGELPANLKRGVLSEDGLYNLLMENASYQSLLSEKS